MEQLYLRGEFMDYRQQENNELQRLKADLKAGQPKRLYVFHGEEAFLLEHYLGQLKKLLIEELTESFNYHKLTKENFDIRSFADAVESLPMMAPATFVWVDDIDIFKLPEDERSKICDIFGDIPEYCTVVMTYKTVQWKPDKRLKKLYDTVTTCASVVEFPKQSQKDLIAWITRHFAAEKKQISQELCSYLIELTGGTMTALAGEISKICAFSGADAIVKSDIDAVTEPVLDAVVFQMTDLMGEGKYGPALLKLQQLLKMQQAPLSVLGAIGNHFRRISAARILLDNGKGAADLTKLYPQIRDYAAKKTMSTARGFSARFCAVAAELVMETDNKIKTSYDDPERLLELLVLQLAQEASNG